MIRLTKEPFDASEVLATFHAANSGAGGIVSFTGLVRPQASNKAVTSLSLQAYEPMTEQGIEAALDTAMRKWPLLNAHIIHRIGSMVPGDAIVFVATAAAHRRAAFESADYLMDYLKTEAVFWKKETYETGHQWIEPRTQDYQDSARWTKQEGS